MAIKAIAMDIDGTLTNDQKVISPRTREKLLAYLSAQARHAGTSSFEVPLNRQQLADYLAVDRSAMSAELGRMRDEGILSFERGRFTLFKPGED